MRTLLLAQAAEHTTGLSDYGDDTVARSIPACGIVFCKGVNMDEAGQRAAASVCLWLLTSRLELLEDRKRYPIGQEKIEKAPVRDRRDALGHDAPARVALGRPQRASAAILGGDVSLTAAGARRTRRSAPRPRGR
jgi:hypothetical protein